MSARSIRTRCDATRPPATWRRSCRESRPRPEPVPPSPVPSPIPPRPSPLDYVKARRRCGHRILALTGLLGFIATRVFEVVLRIDPDFYLGSGTSSHSASKRCFPSLPIWVLECDGRSPCWSGIRLLLPARLKRPFHRLAAEFRSLNPAGVATVVLLVRCCVALAHLVALLGCVCTYCGRSGKTRFFLYVDVDSRSCQSADSSGPRRVFRRTELRARSRRLAFVSTLRERPRQTRRRSE